MVDGVELRSQVRPDVLICNDIRERELASDRRDRKRVEELTNVRFHSAREKKSDEERREVDSSDGFDELRYQFAVITLVQRINNYHHWRSKLSEKSRNRLISSKSNDRLDYELLKLMFQWPMKELGIAAQSVLDKFLRLWNRCRELEGESGNQLGSLAQISRVPEETEAACQSFVTFPRMSDCTRYG